MEKEMHWKLRNTTTDSTLAISFDGDYPFDPEKRDLTKEFPPKNYYFLCDNVDPHADCTMRQSLKKWNS